jgi:hypothetical protein
MRFQFPITIVTLLLTLCLTSPLAARGGKGGPRGKGAVSRGPAPGGQQHGGHRHGSAADRQDLADSHKKSPKDSHGKHSHEHEHAADGSHEHEGGGDLDTGEETPYNKKEKQLSNFQRQRDQKLAQAEHLRQIAEQNGNTNLLANADRMEAQALDEYARKVAHLERFGVTDPTLNPGSGVTDPVLPNVDSLIPSAQPAAIPRQPSARRPWRSFRW